MDALEQLFQKHSIDYQVRVLHKTTWNKFFVILCNSFATTPIDELDVYAVRTSKHFTFASPTQTYLPNVYKSSVCKMETKKCFENFQRFQFASIINF